MFEPSRLPVNRGMTATAVRSRPVVAFNKRRKLAAMRVLMTVRTDRRKIAKSDLLRNIACAFFPVARAARYRLMAAFEFESRSGVIEADYFPALHRMAIFAAALVSIFIDLAFMRVGMTVKTPHRLEDENRADGAVVQPGIPVAGGAGYGQMRT